MKAKFEINEMLGIMIYMLSELVGRLKQNRIAMIAVFLVVALGVSALIGGAVTYLTSYGSDNSAAAMAAEPAILDAPEVSTSMPTATVTPMSTPTQSVIVVNKPAGEWTEESCTAAGNQISAEMASFWTSPQGTGCNLLINGTWAHLP